MLPQFPAGVRQGDRVLVSYEDDDWWHERAILGFCPPDLVCIATPHWDLYQENVADYDQVLLFGPRGGIPAPARGMARVEFNVAELGRRIANFIVRARRSAPGMLDILPDPPPGVPGGGGQAILPTAAEVVPLGGDKDELEEIWVALESRYNVEEGAPVDTKAWVVHRFGDRGIAVKIATPSMSFAVARAGTFDRDAPGRRDAEQDSDMRTLAVQYDQRGERTRDFAITTKELSETEFKHWPLRGPRTCLWVLSAIRQQGYTPAGRHVWWKQSLGLAASDPGVEEHGILSDLLEAGVSFDALNVSELLCFEMVARRYQVWEEYYKDSLRRANTSFEMQTSLDAEERDLYMGQRFGRGAALVCPQLESHVADVLKDRAALSKEKRKARENLMPSPSAISPAAKPGPKRKGKHDGEKGDGG